jgi:predicted ATP-dependent Lon-type protease
MAKKRPPSKKSDSNSRAKTTMERLGLKGFNTPKKTPGASKSHVVMARENGKTKLIRFGQQGVSGAGKNPKSEKQKARRKSFKARHAKNINKGKMSAAYWADKVKWIWAGLILFV